jgi:glycosyltransferase involved in cell wall biosynthesis
MSRKPRVYYFINGFQRGGAEQGLLRLVAGGAFEGCDLRVASIIGGDDGMIERLNALGAQVTVFVDRSRMKFGDLLKVAPRLLNALADFRPDVTILSLPQANILGRLASYLAPAGIIASFEHNTHLANRLYEVAYRLTSRRVSWTLADAPSTARDAQRRLYLGAPRSTIILPLVSFPSPSATPAGAGTGPLRVVNAARFTKVKNQAALVEATALLRDRGCWIDLTLFGEGPERESCLARVAALGLKDRVRLPGYVDGWGERQSFDVFALSSRHEGLCISVLEAMHGGLGVVAPLIGGIRDYGDSSVMEILGDVEAATLADALGRLDQDRSRLAAIARAGQAMVADRFSQAGVSGDYHAFSQRLHAAAASNSE